VKSVSRIRGFPKKRKMEGRAPRAFARGEVSWHVPKASQKLRPPRQDAGPASTLPKDQRGEAIRFICAIRGLNLQSEIVKKKVLTFFGAPD
jgi:hypothetical protein